MEGGEGGGVRVEVCGVVVVGGRVGAMVEREGGGRSLVRVGARVGGSGEGGKVWWRLGRWCGFGVFTLWEWEVVWRALQPVRVANLKTCSHWLNRRARSEFGGRASESVVIPSLYWEVGQMTFKLTPFLKISWWKTASASRASPVIMCGASSKTLNCA